MASGETASTAYGELVRRKRALSPDELHFVGRNEARMGVSRDYLRRFQGRLKAGRDWILLEAITLPLYLLRLAFSPPGNSNVNSPVNSNSLPTFFTESSFIFAFCSSVANALKSANR